MTKINTKVEFTDKWVKGIKCPVGLPQQAFTDTLSRNGFTLVVSSGGTKTFYGFYRGRDDVKKRLKLGAYPDLSLAQARAKWREIRTALIDEAIDPVDEKKAEAQALTLAVEIGKYLESKAGLRSIGEIARRLNKNIVPVIGNIKLADLHKRDFTRCFDVMLARGATVEATLCFEDCRALCNWAFGRGDLDTELLRGMSPPFVKGKSAKAADKEGDEEGRVLSPDEIRHVWLRLPEAAMSVSTQRILQLMLLTACRVSEISEIRRGEIDFAGRMLRLPKSRVKNKRPHDVPLSDMALDILRQQLADIDRLAERMGRDAGDRVFPGRGGRGSITNEVVGKCLGRETILGKDSVKRTLGIPHWTSHDLRRSAATLMEAAGQNPLVIAYVLNHASVTHGTITSRIYAKYTYEREKREAIDVLAGRIDAIVRDDAQVIPLRKKRS